MKICLVKDEDSLALLRTLELAKLRKVEHLPIHDPQRFLIDEAHRLYHYHVVRWLQEQGLETVK